MFSIADGIVRVLRHAGVRTLFGVPGGGSNLDLIAAAARGGLPFVLTATESAAAIAALAQAEVSGAPGACLATLGPGAASMVNGIACAHLERAPVVVFTDAYAQPNQTCAHQRLDHAAVFHSIVKMSAALTLPCAVSTVERAVGAALSDPPGPVHLDCPGDLLATEIAPPHSETRAFEVTPPSRPQATPSSASHADFDALVRRATKPVALVGLGARRPGDAAAVRALCERRGLPALVTYKAKGVVADSHPWFAGVFTHASVERRLLEESDLLIGIGLDPVELLPRPWNYAQPIVYAGAGTPQPGQVPFAAALIAPGPAAIARLEELLPPSSWRHEQVLEAAHRQRRSVRCPARGLSAHRVVDMAADRLEAAAVRVTVDAGAHMFAATTLWPAREPNQMLISNGLSTMGFAVPAAIGAARLEPQRPVVALTGDGGLLMCAGELATIVREHLLVIVIVFNDASLSLIELKQQARQLPPAGVSLGTIDWCALARSVGMQGAVAASEDHLAAAMDEALATAAPMLIDARIDRSNYAATVRAVRG